MCVNGVTRPRFLVRAAYWTSKWHLRLPEVSESMAFVRKTVLSDVRPLENL